MTWLSGALTALVEVQETVAVEEPDAKIERAFRHPPPKLQRADLPCVMNRLFFDAGEVSWGMGQHKMVVPTLMRIVVQDDDVAVAEGIAEELLWALSEVLIQQQTLGGAVSKVLPVSAGPVGDLEYPAESGKWYVSADVTVQLVFEIPALGSGG